jgi:hypothetical protein
MNEESTIQYVLVENQETGHQAIRLTEGPYSSIMYTYGKVEFEDPDSFEVTPPKIKFEYEIIDDMNIKYNKEAFENYIGDLLVELLRHGIENNDITYTGGIDE